MFTQSNPKKFRSAIIPLTIFVFVGSVAVFLIELWIMRSHGRHMDARAVKISIGILAGLSLVISWLLSVCFPAGLSAEGIYGHSIWGVKRFAAWPEIVQVRKFYLFNLTWLRIYAADGSVTWVALFQSRKAEFQSEIRSFAPSKSPVLEILR